jgi:hypothetical protein
VDVCDAPLIEFCRKRLATKLRVSTRPRESPHVGDGFDPFFHEQVKEFGQVTIGMANGPQRIHGHSLWRLRSCLRAEAFETLLQPRP